MGVGIYASLVTKKEETLSGQISSSSSTTTHGIEVGRSCAICPSIADTSISSSLSAEKVSYNHINASIVDLMKQIITQRCACIPILPSRIELCQIIFITARGWIIAVAANGTAGAIHFGKFACSRIATFAVGSHTLNRQHTAEWIQVCSDVVVIKQ
jgi:hypothetical protein